MINETTIIATQKIRDILTANGLTTIEGLPASYYADNVILATWGDATIRLTVETSTFMDARREALAMMTGRPAEPVKVTAEALAEGRTALDAIGGISLREGLASPRADLRPRR